MKLDDEDELTPEEQAELDRLMSKMTPERLEALAKQSQEMFENAKPDIEEGTRPCLFCQKELECAVDSWKTKQPYAGGEVQLIFSYGSTEYDLGMSNTVFSAYVCDECAKKLVPKMRQETNLNAYGS